ncbi:2-succinyl-6-hydroxy-2,4-cyclohexadiene-1-carboxylate synthase [Bacillus sp. FJAT-50079]|uniref:2-succinyl-6-hydroxy-2, 4-cyclohexadiene-1-carboxylate synthase n=1 Tax=Bacillus sp. FJAT-50079 TaxID=2833577 RepID=UPI001BC92147|nr:2-succinyl-6-hydroxy-2,4-cyclohexadiene-1-carboxylate synthase [Bacillus sp. FJAT-50079]MBS4208579.1 2-succinyl-6-hydroxy-2,4-cyclohexadiene-1-carboxylate synthase [Bacillus sp. FJAT-50079]
MRLSIGEVDYYVEVSGEGPSIMLLHGFTGDVTTWNDLKKILVANYKVIAIDIIGHGQTTAPNDVEKYDMCQVANDLSCIVDQLDAGQVQVLGYSMGGRLALTFALLFPEKVRGLILESASPGLKTREEREARKDKDELLARRIIKNGMEDFVAYWEQIPLFASQQQLPEKIREQIRGQRLQNSSEGLANSLRGMGTGQQPSFWEDLHKIVCPVLLVCGEDDEKFCTLAMEMEKLLPHAELSTFVGVGHAVHVEEPEKFGTIVREFLHKGGKRCG